MSDNFISYLKCVGTGPRHNRDLSFDEMADAMAQMLGGQATPEQTAAFLLGWRLKPESVTEFRAALEVLDAHTQKHPVPESLELGYPFDGKIDNPYLFPLAAKFLAPFGLPLVVYGDALQPSKGGVTVRDVARAVPLPGNVRFFERHDYCPALARLSPVRKKLGLRTGLNTLERLPNVAGSPTAMIGVFHKPFVRKYVEIFAPRYRRLVVVKGNEGTPEIFGKTRLWLCEEGRCEEMVVDPARYGVTYEKSFRRSDHAALLQKLADPAPELVELARFNAAVWLFAADRAETPDDAWEMVGG